MLVKTECFAQRSCQPLSTGWSSQTSSLHLFTEHKQLVNYQWKHGTFYITLQMYSVKLSILVC